MDEKAKETALKYMANLVEKTPPPTKFAISFPESREVTEGMLLGMYGAQVKYRDMDFILDDATVSKVEKVVRWMYDSRKRGLLLCGTLGNGKTTMLRSLKKLFGFKKKEKTVEEETASNEEEDNNSSSAVDKVLMAVIGVCLIAIIGVLIFIVFKVNS